MTPLQRKHTQERLELVNKQRDERRALGISPQRPSCVPNMTQLARQLDLDEEINLPKKGTPAMSKCENVRGMLKKQYDVTEKEQCRDRVRIGISNMKEATATLYGRIEFLFDNEQKMGKVPAEAMHEDIAKDIQSMVDELHNMKKELVG